MYEEYFHCYTVYGRIYIYQYANLKSNKRRPKTCCNLLFTVLAEYVQTNEPKTAEDEKYL